jgi:hypothetical protein
MGLKRKVLAYILEKTKTFKVSFSTIDDQLNKVLSNRL